MSTVAGRPTRHRPLDPLDGGSVDRRPHREGNRLAGTDVVYGTDGGDHGQLLAGRVQEAGGDHEVGQHHRALVAGQPRGRERSGRALVDGGGQDGRATAIDHTQPAGPDEDLEVTGLAPCSLAQCGIDLLGPHRTVDLVSAGLQAAVPVVQAVHLLGDGGQLRQGGGRCRVVGARDEGRARKGEAGRYDGDEDPRGTGTHVPGPSEAS